MINDRGYPKEWRGLPSVTEVMPKTDFSHITPQQLERARIQGTNNHLRVKRFLTNGDDRKSPYIKLFRQFLEENEKQLGRIVIFEEPLASKKHGYKGTADLVFEHGIVDLKRTFWETKRHALQLAGYNMLTAENKILKKTKNRFILTIHTDENCYRLRNVWVDKADEVFLALLKRWQIDQYINAYLYQSQ
jgi:hypothetical protein